MTLRHKIISKKYSEREIVNELEQFIIDNRLSVGTPLSSARQMAERYNVSQMTINRAISKLVDKKIVYRKRGSGTFVNRIFPGLGTHLCTVGIGAYQPLISNKEGFDEAFGARSTQLIDKLKAEGCRINLLTRTERKDINAFKHFLSEIDVLAINKDLVTPEHLRILLDYKKPVVILNLPQIRQLPFNQIIPDCYLSFCQGVECFEKHGSTEVLIAAANNTEAHEYRRELFKEIVCSHGRKLKVIGDLSSSFILGDMGQRLGNMLGRKYLERKDRPAIFCVSDFLAFGITETLLNAGLRPGKDFKLISFDNLEGLGVIPFSEPVISSLEYKRNEIVSEEVNMVLSLVANPSANPRIVMVPCGDLVVRKTC